MFQRLKLCVILLGVILASEGNSQPRVSEVGFKDTNLGQVNLVNRRFDASIEDISNNLVENTSPKFPGWSADLRIPETNGETFLLYRIELNANGYQAPAPVVTILDPDLQTELFVSIVPGWKSYQVNVTAKDRKFSKELAVRAIKIALPKFQKDVWEIQALVAKKIE